MSSPNGSSENATGTSAPLIVDGKGTTSNTVAPPILEAREVTMNFGGVQALSDVSVSFVAGEVCGLIGPNGAGKTTFFDCLTGVRRPTAGSIHFDGEDVTSRSATWCARHGIRRTFQRQQIFGWLPVEDNVLVALEWKGGGGGMAADLLALPTRRSRERARRSRVDEVLELCGLESLRGEPAANLPIGRARMVELARAVVDRPRILLLDEPTSGLEESEAENLAIVVRRLCQEEGCAVVLVEHDVGFVMRECHRVIVLNLGSVIANGVPDVVRADEAVRAAYLG
jgi:branched-chain amino acid transport system ATP-binding protein